MALALCKSGSVPRAELGENRLLCGDIHGVSTDKENFPTSERRQPREKRRLSQTLNIECIGSFKQRSENSTRKAASSNAVTAMQNAVIFFSVRAFIKLMSL